MTPPEPPARSYGPDEARADATQRGYHTPGSLRALLGLHRWEFEAGRREGVVPAPDRTVGRYERWSVEAAENMFADAVPTRVRGVGPHSPPMGSHKAAEYLRGWCEWATVDDVRSLVELGLLAPCGEYNGHPLFDVRDLDEVTSDDMGRAEARTRRRRQEGILLYTAQCCRLLGIRVSDWRYLVALGWISPVEERPGPGGWRQAQLYRASDVEDLLKRDVDWEAVRATPKGARSLLLDVAQ